MKAEELTREMLRQALQIGDRADKLRMDSPLLGHFPELNSLTVVNLLAAIEEQTGAPVDDEEISEELFQTFGSLVAFVRSKLD